MATKKQKRQAALEKRERMLAAERKIGLEALAKAQMKRERERRQAEADAARRRSSAATKQLNALFRAGREASVE